jgi:hypothetical protein
MYVTAARQPCLVSQIHHASTTLSTSSLRARHRQTKLSNSACLADVGTPEGFLDGNTESGEACLTATLVTCHPEDPAGLVSPTLHTTPHARCARFRRKHGRAKGAVLLITEVPQHTETRAG